MKTEYGYKLFERKGDQIFPLFIDKSSPVPVGEWIPAENHPTKGFASGKVIKSFRFLLISPVQSR